MLEAPRAVVFWQHFARAGYLGIFPGSNLTRRTTMFENPGDYGAVDAYSIASVIARETKDSTEVEKTRNFNLAMKTMEIIADNANRATIRAIRHEQANLFAAA